jgi:hypothetical protein
MQTKDGKNLNGWDAKVTLLNLLPSLVTPAAQLQAGGKCRLRASVAVSSNLLGVGSLIANSLLLQRMAPFALHHS